MEDNQYKTKTLITSMGGYNNRNGQFYPDMKQNRQDKRSKQNSGDGHIS